MCEWPQIFSYGVVYCRYTSTQNTCMRLIKITSHDIQKYALFTNCSANQSVVTLILPHLVRLLSWIQVDSTTSVVWSPTGSVLGPIHFLLYTAGLILWTVSALRCRRHPDLWLLLTRGHRQSMETSCWLCCCRHWLDAFQSTSTECIQYGGTVYKVSYPPIR